MLCLTELGRERRKQKAWKGFEVGFQGHAYAVQMWKLVKARVKREVDHKAGRFLCSECALGS